MSGWCRMGCWPQAYGLGAVMSEIKVQVHPGNPYILLPA